MATPGSSKLDEHVFFSHDSIVRSVAWARPRRARSAAGRSMARGSSRAGNVGLAELSGVRAKTFSPARWGGGALTFGCLEALLTYVITG